MRSKRLSSYVGVLLAAALTVSAFPQFVSASNVPVTLSTDFEAPAFVTGTSITNTRVNGWASNSSTAPFNVIADGDNGNVLQADPESNSFYLSNNSASFPTDMAFSGQVKDLADTGAHPGLLRYKDSKDYYALGLTGGNLEWRGKVNNVSASMPNTVALGDACKGGSAATYCTLNFVVSGPAMYGSAKNGPSLIAKVDDNMSMADVPYIGFVAQKGIANFDNPYATDTPLGSPGDLSGSYSGTTVDLSWSGVAGADSYVIRRSTAVSGPYLYAGTSSVTTFIDTGVANPGAYYYMISPAKATPQGSSVEGIPGLVSIGATSLKATSDDNEIDLSWSAFASAAGYTIWRSTAGGGYVQIGMIADGATTAYRDTTAVNGTSYSYRVKAVTAGDSKTPSLTVGNAAPLTAAAGVKAPNVPTGLTATPTATAMGIALSWSQVSGATGYSVWRSTTSGSGYARIGTTAGGTATSYSDTGIANGTYYYVVQATNMGGSSANSAEVSATLNVAAIGVPTGLTAAAAGDATIALTWQPVSGATGYVVLRSMRSGSGYTRIGTTAADATGYTDSGVENGTFYYVVQAVNAAGPGSSSAEASATLTAPSAPIGLAADASASTQVALQWNAVSGATGYKVLRSTKDGSEYTTVGTTASGTTSFADQHIASGTTYYYVVQATNDGGAGASSQQASATPVYTVSSGTTVNVSTADELDAALAAAQAGTTIVLADGSYTKNGAFELKGKVGTITSPITIKAVHAGRAIITGAAYMKVSSSSAFVTVQGLRFTNTDNVSLLLDSSNSLRVTDCSFEQMENRNNASVNIPYMQIRGANSNYIQVDHNVFANKTQQGQGMSIDGNGGSSMSQYLTIEYNLFRNIGPRIDNGMESIRLGLSGVSMLSGYAVVQFNEFDNCDGDPESISVKSSNNTIRYNTFHNSQSQLTLRHGNGTEVYGNYFIGDGVKQGVGGIRMYGADHKVYNNYFQGLTLEGILIDNGDVDHGPAISTYKAYSGDFTMHWPIYRAQIVNNTVVNSKYGITVGHPTYSVNPKYFKEPVDTVVANNLVTNTTYDAYPETIKSNTVFLGNMGFAAQPSSNPDRTSAEIRNVDPQLSLQADGVYRLTAGSPAIGAAVGNFPYVLDDLDGQPRGAVADVGADEYSTAAVQREPVSYVGYPILLDANVVTLQMEAEKYSFVQGDLTAAACPACSGGTSMKAGGGAATADASLMYRLDAAGGGTYYVHLLGSGTVSPSTVIMSVDGGSGVPVSMAAGAMGWSSASTPFVLSKGLHDLVLKPQQGGIQFDKLAVSKSSKPPIASSLPKASDIQVNGISLPDFAPAQYSYTVQLPVGTQRVPIVSAASAGVVQVTQPTTVFGTATVHVTDSNDPYSATDYTVTLTGLPTYGTITERLLPYPIVGATSSDFKPPYSHTNAYDGNMSTRFAASGEQWATFDIGQVKPVQYVLISFYNGNQDQYSFDLEASADNSVWKRVYSGYSSRSTANLELFQIPLTQARYIKFDGHGNSKDAWNNIVEIVIAGQSPVASVQLNAPDSLKVGQSAAGTLNAVYADGSQAPIAQGVGFVSSNPGAATVDSAGTIRAVSTGSTVITATYGLFQASKPLAIVPPAPAASSNADLSGIALSSGGISPAFASGTTAYVSSVANVVSSLTVTASVYDSNATMMVNGILTASGQASRAISLNIGSNPISIVVQAQNGTTKTYLVTVDRAPTSSSGSGSTTSTNTIITSTDGTLTLPTGRTGEVSLGDEVTISIPANATNKELKVTIEKVLDTQKLLTGKNALASPIFEILKNFSENFSNPVTLTFAFDPASMKDNQKPSVFYYDEVKKLWVEVGGGKVNGNHISVESNHFTKYAVFAVDLTAEVPTKDPSTDTKTTVKFSDISGHWAETNIKQAVSSGIVTGYSDSTFMPEKTVTRAEFAVMLMNTLKPQGAGTTLTFTDSAKIGSWAQKAVAQAVQAGIIKGYEDSTFRPDEAITRAEMAAMLANVLGQSNTANTATGFADDKDIPAWAKASVAYVKQAGIVQGKGDNQFAPQDHATRAEAITVLLNMLAQKSK